MERFRIYHTPIVTNSGTHWSEHINIRSETVDFFELSFDGFGGFEGTYNLEDRTVGNLISFLRYKMKWYKPPTRKYERRPIDEVKNKIIPKLKKLDKNIRVFVA